jgi:hypothetical protein
MLISPSKFCLATFLVSASILRCSSLVSFSAAVSVNPSIGSDTVDCGAISPCKTISYAICSLGASYVVLSAGVFNESVVNITNVTSLVIVGVKLSTVFDCSSRLGPAFNIVNSTVNITGVTFQSCSNPTSTGGAVSTSGSSIVVSQCSFIACSAASGGAVSVTGPGEGLYLFLQNSSFVANSANGGLATCPADASQPCSTWGGALAVFEILNVTVSGCYMVNNTVQALVPTSAQQYRNMQVVRGGNAVAGGGCVSVLISINASNSSVLIIGNKFLRCTVVMSLKNNNVLVGNGYGGALSVYFGISAGLQMLDLFFLSLAFHSNEFTLCIVTSSTYTQSNAYGGGISVYLGGYSSLFRLDDLEVAIGNTTVRNIFIDVNAVAFKSCSVSTLQGNAYGGSFSFCVGGYAFSRSNTRSNSRSGFTTATGVSVSIRNMNSSDCSVMSSGSQSYGGSLNVCIGSSAMAFGTSKSSSDCGTTNITDLMVSICGSTFANSSSVSRSPSGNSGGSNVYGGTASILIGSYSRSSIAQSGDTYCSRCVVNVSDIGIVNSIASSIATNDRTGGSSAGATVYGGAISIAIGAYAYSSSLSVCGTTNVSSFSFSIGRSMFVNSSAISQTDDFSFGSSAYGGTISVLLGSYSWSATGPGQFMSTVQSGNTYCNRFVVNLSDVEIVNSSASSITTGSGDDDYVSSLSRASDVYGGAMSLVIGAYLASSSEEYQSFCFAGETLVSNFLMFFKDSRISDSHAATYSFKSSSVGSNAIGGAVAIVVGSFVYNNPGLLWSYITKVGASDVRDSRITFADSLFSNCLAVSHTGGSAFGSTSVYGGALGLLHSPQVSTFSGLTFQRIQAFELSGSNLTFFILRCSFTACFAATKSGYTVPGLANASGGALYISSVAFSQIDLLLTSFRSCAVKVAIGAVGSPSDSSGGGVSVSIPKSTHASILFLSNTFWNCSASGAGQYSPFTAVRGGGLAVFSVPVVKVVNTSFSACCVTGTSSFSVVSGGAAFSVVLAMSISLVNCSFDGAHSQDSSGTTAGLLVLSSIVVPTHLSLDGCRLSSSNIPSLYLACVDKATGFRSAPCMQPGPVLSATNSNFSQLTSSGSESIFVGSSVMSLQQNVTVISSESLIVCNSPQFAVFRKSFLENVVFFCGPCPIFQVSLTSDVTLLQTASSATSIDQCASLISTTSCPFGIDYCTTFVNVTSGFWAAFQVSSSTLKVVLTNASRCPAGYCGCKSSSSCMLPPPLSQAARSNPLCNGNRAGVLCGACISGFTQSLDGHTCISNELCSRNLWWVWTLSILWWAVFGLGIVVSSSGRNFGEISCLLFFFQMSSFASSIDTYSSNRVSEWTLLVAQFNTIFSITSLSCWAPNMSAYYVTVFKLLGPCFVLIFAIAWTRCLNVARPKLQLLGVELVVSYSGSCAVTLFFVFSNLASVLFTLLMCTSDGLLFVDGNVNCYSSTRSVLIGVVVMMCCVPILFAVALFRNKLPDQARFALCCAYTERLFFWGALTTGFRFLMSITLLLVPVQYPNVTAFAHLVLSVIMLLLLVLLRPYVAIHTFWIDVSCYLCLIAQFGLQTINSTRDALGISQNPWFFDSLMVCGVVSRYIPVAVCVIALLKGKISFVSLARSVRKRFGRFNSSNGGSNAEMKQSLM